MTRTDDVIQETLRRAAEQLPALTPEMQLLIELEIRALFGGERVFIAKRAAKTPGREPTPQALIAKALADIERGRPLSEVSRAYGISRTALYRIRRGTR